MALRTFRSNPSLGGFGSETTALEVRDTLADPTTNVHDGVASDCDAFAQIIKELVDNAVDACCMSHNNGEDDEGGGSRGRKKKKTAAVAPSSSSSSVGHNRRVRVVIEEFTPPSSTTRAAAKSSQDDSDDDDDESTKKKKGSPILRVTVSDNGCGMPNIQDCVEAFRSSKADNTSISRAAPQRKGSTGGSSSNKPTAKQAQAHQPMTAGRYGIGLTLCLLHAQRLVPDSSACITSATPSATHFTRAQYVVDTEGDSVRCVERTLIPKQSPDESGTSVSVLIPGGLTARMAWPRLANYFARFGLCLGISCSLEVMAATLTKVPLFVRPPLEKRQQQQQRQKQGVLEAVDSNSQGQSSSSSSQEEKEEEENWGGVFDDQEDEQKVSIGSPLQDATRSAISSTNATTVSPAETVANDKRVTEQEDSDSCKEIHRAVELYLGQSVDAANLARSRQPIRIEGKPKKRSKRRHTGPSLELVIVVCGVRDEEQPSDQDEDMGSDGDDEDPLSPMTPTDARMTIVRMVNRIPLLDGAEANSCGLVQGILQKRRVWNSFGLEVSSTGIHEDDSADAYNEEKVRLQVPTFQVRDSDQVMPFIRNANHSLLEDPFGDEEEDSESDGDVDVEDVFDRGFSTRKRRRNSSKRWLLPARVRLGNILIIVQIDAEPSQLPLPTLSKGRLPSDIVAIDKALEVALMDCLRSIQRTNPLLWLTTHQLKRAERDAQYVPAVASSLASIISKSNNSYFRKSMTSMIRKFDCSGIDKSNAESDDEDAVREESEDEGDEVGSASSSKRSNRGDGGELLDEEEAGEDALETATHSSQKTNSSRSEAAQQSAQVRELGERIEARLRKVVTAHDEPPKTPKSSKRAKLGDEVGGNDGADNGGDDDKSQLSQNSLRSYDFSTVSDDLVERLSKSSPRPLDAASDLEDADDEVSEGSELNAKTVNNIRDAFDDDDDDDDEWW